MSRLSALIAVLALAFSSLLPANQVAASSLPPVNGAFGPLCGIPTTVRLLSEKNVDAGTVTVANGAATLYVTYTTKANYRLTTTQVAVANTLAAIPVTSKGNPIPGQFPYQARHARATTFTYIIPRSSLGSTIYVAAHADVVKMGTTRTEGAWGEGTAFVPDKRSWGMYFTVAIQSCNKPPVANPQSVTTDEETPVGITLTGSDPDGNPISFSLVTPPAHGTLGGTIPNYTYSPNLNFNGQDSFTFKTNDGQLSSAPATVTITVRPVNDPPTASDGSANTLEDAAVAIDLGALAGDVETADANLVYVIDIGPGHGSLSGSGPSVNYLPGANYFGPDSFTFHVEDRGDPDNCGTVGPACAAALASSSHLVSITVGSVNDAPSFALPTASNQTVLEDAGAQSVAGFATDISAGPANEAGQMLTFHVSNNNGALFSVQPSLDPTTGNLIYTPAANANGSATVSVYLTDNGGTANGGADTSPTQTFVIQVTPINDAPSFALPGSPNQTILQDAGPQMVPAFATALSAGPADEAGQALMFHVSNDNAALFFTAPDIDEATGNLTYQAAAGASGSATVSVYLTDNGGTANGGVDTSGTQTLLITVVPPNASPVAQGQTPTTNEDTLLHLTLTGTDSDSPSLTFAIVDSPAHGSLGSLGAVTCAAGTCSADVDYTPAADFNGNDSFTFKVNDGQTDSNTATAAITVNAVNDPPSFTAGANQTVNEDAGPQTVAGWATAISPGPADESGQAVSFNVTGNTNPGLFAAGPAVDANGELTYTPAASAFGVATITLVAQDDGGTANGGSDASAPQTFDITVNAINDAPSFTAGANQTVDEDAGAQSVTGWATGISAGPANEGSQVITFVIDTNDNPALFSAGPAVASDGTLTFTPAANKNGVANITLHVEDDGGTANGGVDASAPQGFTITVNAVNDPPLAIAHSYSAQANMQIVGLTGLLTGASDPDETDAGFTSQLQVGSVSGTTPAGGTVTLIDASAGTFTFDPPPGVAGNVTFTYTVCDNGNPTPSECSAPATVTVSVAGPVIWFVNGSVTGPGTGTLVDPFKTVAAADAVDAANQRIFLYAGTYANGITLNTSEWLVGQGVTGASFDSLFGITPPAGTIARPGIGGTRPIVQGQITLGGNGAAVRGLNVQPGSGTQGLTANAVTSLVVSEVSVTTSNATAVNLSGGASGTFSFTAINANGGTSGIVLSNANAASGSFTVTGTGAAGSGGTIQNMTDSGILGATTANVSLSYMNIVNNGNALGEDGIRMTGLSGTNSLTSSTISGGYEDNIFVQNTSGMSSLTIQGPNCSITNNNSSQGNTGITVLSAGTANMTAVVNNCQFNGNRSDTIHVDAGDSAALNATISNNTITAGSPNQGNIGIEVTSAGSAVVTYAVTNNKVGTNGVTSAPLLNTGINVFAGGSTTSLSGSVTGNTVVNAGTGSGFGIRVFSNGSATPGSTTVVADVSNNTVSNVALDYGILAEASGTSFASTLKLKLTNNNVSVLSGALDAIRVQARNTSTVCSRISGNTTNTGGAGFVGLYVRQANTATFNLEGLALGSQTAAATQAYAGGQNPAAATVGAIAATNFTGVAANFCGSIP